MSDFYNYHEGGQESSGQSANDYNYYRQTSDETRRRYSPYVARNRTNPGRRRAVSV